MMQKLSSKGRALIEQWEEFVPYVYDDKIRKRHINGKLQYPEWDGSNPVGTLTIGYGHTDAAGYPKIKQGMRITKEQADEILADDIAPCEADVRRLVKVPLTQHQFDALVSFCFNCGAGNLKKLIVRLNQGDYDDIPRRMMQYVTSKGERMQGLVNRRAAEIKLWNTPDDPHEEEAHGNSSPQGGENDPPKSIIESKTGNASIGIGLGGASVAVSAFNEAAEPVKEAIGNVKDLGVMDYFVHISRNPRLLLVVAVVLILLAVFIWWDRRRKLTQEHV